MKKKPLGDDLCTWLFFGLIVFYLKSKQCWEM